MDRENAMLTTRDSSMVRAATDILKAATGCSKCKAQRGRGVRLVLTKRSGTTAQVLCQTCARRGAPPVSLGRRTTGINPNPHTAAQRARLEAAEKIAATWS